MVFWLHNFLNFANPALRTLIPTISVAYAFQIAVSIPAIIYQEDRFYDFSGSLTYLGCTTLSLYLPTLRARSLAKSQGLPLPSFPAITTFHPRQIIMSGLTVLWTTRLGSFLFQRVLKSGGDSRFNKLKKRPKQFFVFWVGQATWVSLVALPIFALNAIPAHLHPPLNWKDFVGVAVWTTGFITEVVADHQKTQWKKDRDEKRHNDEWITRGLWGKSRHPNYFGECIIWTGVFLASAHILNSVSPLYPPWFGYTMIVSPLFTTFILKKISGIPPLERQMDKRFRGRKDYEEYKKNTPIFIPKL